VLNVTARPPRRAFLLISVKESLSTIRPSVPDIRPAAIEPLWQNGKLALPDMPPVRQFPKWRAFVRDAADRKLANKQIAGVLHVVESIIEYLPPEEFRQPNQICPESVNIH
jgi:hypothetical protein